MGKGGVGLHCHLHRWIRTAGMHYVIPDSAIPCASLLGSCDLTVAAVIHDTDKFNDITLLSCRN